MSATAPCVGSPPTCVEELAGLRMTTVVVGSYDTNAYLLECRATGQRLLIDAAAEPDALLALLPDRVLDQVLTTHYHVDHWQALPDVVAATGATTLMHPADAVGVPTPTAVHVRDGDQVTVGAVGLEVVHLVGHTAGSIALVHRGPGGPVHVWTGDTLFPGGVGRTHGEPRLFRSLLSDVETRLFDVFGDDTRIHPGHGPSTTLGAERPHLLSWKERGW